MTCGAAGRELLAEAVSVLEHSPAQMHYTHALRALGARPTTPATRPPPSQSLIRHLLGASPFGIEQQLFRTAPLRLVVSETRPVPDPDLSSLT